MNQINERIEALRRLMAERRMDGYMIPTADFHESEYVGDHFKCRQYMTGFTGSAGTAVITMEEACLWVDGRYFVQAARQLEGTCVKMMKMGQEDVPSVEEYLEEKLPEGGCLGFDGRVVNALSGADLEDRLEGKGISVAYQEDLVGLLWKDCPEISKEPAWVLDTQFAGKSAEEKIKELREELRKVHGTVHVLTSLDDIAWLLNIRGNDIRSNPVILSYLMVTDQKLRLFIHESVLDGTAYPYLDDAGKNHKTTRQYLDELGVEILPYNQIYEEIGLLRQEKVLLEKGKVNYSIFRRLDPSNKVIDRMNPTAMAKAVKNPVEIENIKKAHIKDGVAVTRFICWMKKNSGKIPMDELSVSEYLESFRKEQEGYLEPSFDTISAYGAHGAMCHYSATEETNVPVEPRSFYLVDSGGHYYEGTTDITRTIAMGPLTDEEKEHFTLVLISMLRLGAVRFLHGCRGLSLDYVAREPFWSRGLNFDHGTGHGVSYLGSVHERPNGIRFRMVPERQDNGILEPGMVTSDEPGIYIEGKHGIRTENLILCVEDEKNEYGQFLKFQFLTFVPIDLDAVEPALMTERDKELLNTYHRQVYEKISPYLNEEEKAWLKEAARAI